MSWPTPIKKLQARFPGRDIVQMRITDPKGASIAFDGVASAAIKQALADVFLVAESPPPAATESAPITMECFVCGATEEVAALSYLHAFICPYCGEGVMHDLHA